jgi:hypothetical protein
VIRSGPGQAAFVFLLILAEVFGLQWLNDSYGSGFGASPDEAAHFLSSVMLHDFVQRHELASPMRFAQDFYVHYPKVAIGNWPPLLYMLLGAWFLITGVSRTASLVFIAGAEALTGTAIFVAGRLLLSPLAGLFAAVVYASLPLVQAYSDQVMTELPVTLLIFVATLQFARFAETGRVRDSLLFGGLASLAILTRGSAWCLVMVPPLTILQTQKWRMAIDWRLWLSAVPVGLLCVSWYVLTRGAARGAMMGYGGAPLAYIARAAVFNAESVARATGPLLVVLAAIGLLAVIRSGGGQVWWASVASMVIGVLTIQCIVPASLEPRFMIQLLPAILLFSAAGAQALVERGRLVTGWRSTAVPLAAWGLLVVAVAAGKLSLPNWVRNSGYEEVAGLLSGRDSALAEPVILVASDPIGEGSLIAAVAMGERRPRSVVLRGSKVLAQEDWLGRGTTERFARQGELQRFLDSVPVDFVVLDTTTEERFRRPYHSELLAEMTLDRWRPIASLTVVRKGHTRPDAVHIFVRAAPLPAPTNMRLIAELMKR